MHVGRGARGRKARAAALVAIGAPIWLLGAVAAAQTAPGHSDWPVTPPEQPGSRRLWPPPAPAPPRPPTTSTEASPDSDETPPAPGPTTPAPAAPATEATPPRPTAPTPVPDAAPVADPNQIAAPAAPPPPPAQQQPQWPAGGVFVELRSDDPHMRIDQVPRSGPAVTACEIPCRQILFRKIPYLIQSDEAPPTSTFLLPDGTNRVTLDVRAGSQPLRNLGVVLGVAGGVAAVSGFIGLTTTSGSPSSDKTGLELLGLGAAVGITGIVLFWMSRTSVTSSTGSTFTERRARGANQRRTPAIALTPQGLAF